MIRHDDRAHLADENDIVWLETPEKFDYVRESLIRDAGTRRRPISWKYMPGRLVGYSTLRPEAESWTPGMFVRRAFWVKDYDRSETDGGEYQMGCPAEGVDPRTVSAGVPGRKTVRANGGEAGRTCPACDKPAFLYSTLDRFFHDDGSENRKCWLAFGRNEV